MFASAWSNTALAFGWPLYSDVPMLSLSSYGSVSLNASIPARMSAQIPSNSSAVPWSLASRNSSPPYLAMKHPLPSQASVRTRATMASALSPVPGGGSPPRWR